MAKDKTYQRLIHRGRWVRLRCQVLTEQPLCECCKEEGRIRAASEVHHIVPVESAFSAMEKESLMYDRANLRSLCHDCHVMAHTQMGRRNKQSVKERNAKIAAGIKKRFFG